MTTNPTRERLGAAARTYRVEDGDEPVQRDRRAADNAIAVLEVAERLLVESHATTSAYELRTIVIDKARGDD